MGSAASFPRGLLRRHLEAALGGRIPPCRRCGLSRGSLKRASKTPGTETGNEAVRRAESFVDS